MTKRLRNYEGKQRLIQSTINPLSYLPENIIEEILCKLPCKAMVQAKSVCKTWNSIISSGKFMDYYHKNNRQLEDNLLILFRQKYSYESGNKINFYTLSPSNGNTIVDTDPLEYHNRNRLERDRKDSVTLLGSCNGLVAILDNYKLILWNPLTKEQSFIRVEKNPVLDDIESGYSHGYLFGLCYDSNKDEYVMIVGFEYNIPTGENIGADLGYGRKGYMKVYFYNFKYGSERVSFILTEFRYIYRKLSGGDIGKVIRGIPHWIVNYFESDPMMSMKKQDIVYLDLNEEKFKRMARPDWTHGSANKRMLGLATLDGENQLGCVLHDIVGYGNLEVWVMKEYGNSESWSNMFTFPYMNMVDYRRAIISPSDIDVLGFMPSGELIVYLNGIELWVYDIDKGNFTEMKLYSDFVIVCEPKLISPPKRQIGVRPKLKLKR